MVSKRFLIVPLASSAARIPLPGATIACAVAFSFSRSMRSLSSGVGKCHRGYDAPAPASQWVRPLLPLDGARRFARDVVRDPVDPGHLVDDPRRDALEQLV